MTGATSAGSGAGARPRFRAADLAGLLGLPPPTDEQAAVIESAAPLSVVLAGAGSGKTETMAGRVVYLVANGIVRPEQVLGLTFTRRAATELAGRIRRRLTQLARRRVIDPEVLAVGEPTVVTYDAYAGRIVADHALRLGVEPGLRLIGQAASWQFARRAVDAYDGPMDAVTLSPTTVTNRVFILAGELAQHRVDVESVAEFCDQLAAKLCALPYPRGRSRTMAEDVERIVDQLKLRRQLLPIVVDYRARKRDAEVLDFADQMALAATLAELFPEVGAAERAAFRAVLLDEFQDTSHAQLDFLRALFLPKTAPPDAESPAAAQPWLTVVGDPAQAIYGWRGASHGTFRALIAEAPCAVTVFPLATSFRNSPEILAVANLIAEPLRAGRDTTAVPVLRPRDDAPVGEARCACYPTVEDEAAAVAEYVARVLREDEAARQAGEPGRSIAILLRKWRQLLPLEPALRARGVPIRILGVGGLLDQPEIEDVVATLQVLVDPDRGDALMRLLTGARWRIGAADLAALHRWARRCAAADDRAATESQTLHGPDDRAATESQTSHGPDDAGAPLGGDAADSLSLVDALDRLRTERWVTQSGWFSVEGGRRLARLADELHHLRSRLSQPLPDLVAEVIATIGVDVEVLARGEQPGRSNLDAFLEVAADYADAAENPTLGGFLDYLEAAGYAERGLDRPEDDAAVAFDAAAGERRPGVVDVLTVHAAKGLEWDVVCVPGMVDGVFPTGVRNTTGWLTSAHLLPWPLRGDRDALPSIDMTTADDQSAVVALLKDFAEAVKCHALAEERRLAYVAVTRARRWLFCTGYRWDDTTRAHADSAFLTGDVLGAMRVECWTPVPDDGTANPRLVDGPRRVAWPVDPLGSRRPQVERAAALVRDAVAVAGEPMSGRDDGSAEALTGGEAEPRPRTPIPATQWEQVDGWSRDIAVLLAERSRATEQSAVVLPEQLSVTQLVALREDPSRFAARLRRPLPNRPVPSARRGTAFHRWLEQRFAAPRLLDVDELPGAADSDAAPDDELEALKTAFLESHWASRHPVDVEVPFHLVVDGRVIRGRMDAVFADPDGGFTIVDWKTGRRPRGEYAEAAAVQLGAYRLAWSELSGVPLERVRATFCYLRDGGDYAPADLLDRRGLMELLAARTLPLAGRPRSGSPFSAR
ncbi:UvrD/REP helicase [Acidothermus cellulolyticus 11B]|uniref:DNA 3'-5' helicase n=1 Tax=Acidothermus cellulolyticus (strain ATCC 43068 / DSM 8971 / 11B) TaxID=351607 RepID=A0LVT7_ACIC1|nr:ATP-dependent DNA helicase [Acidothermus cellulolyticus]ABK53547.1 UvrD/REP helicase [Acidothermus cellulolyticus 11B]